jgi:protoheme IX farnesyltransferase
MIGAATENGLQLKESTTFSGGCAALFILTKPGIVAAVTLSGFTGMVMAGRGLPEIVTGFACVASLLLMAAGSALMNSVLDRRMDRQMARLTTRSAALGRIGTGPVIAAAITLTISAVVIALALLNARVALLLVAAAIGYTLYYTLILKRRSPWAAVLGGLPGALPVLIGHAAITARPDTGCLALFLIMLIWQPPHFWLLSLAHREEYRAAGVPVLPLIKGDQVTKFCIYLGVSALLPASLLLRYGGPCSTICTACAFLLGGSYLLACRHFITGSVNYRAAFRGSIAYLLLLFTLIIADLCLPTT